MFLFSLEHDIFWERPHYWIRGKVGTLWACRQLHSAINRDHIIDDSSYRLNFNLERNLPTQLERAS